MRNRGAFIATRCSFWLPSEVEAWDIVPLNLVDRIRREIGSDSALLGLRAKHLRETSRKLVSEMNVIEALDLLSEVIHAKRLEAQRHAKKHD
jgi:hypothetical protein